MAKISAGILFYRRTRTGLEVLLVHPGGPYWAKKDDGAWSIPKGEADAGEELFTAAQRECFEETGYLPEGPALSLTPVAQSGGKIVHAWAMLSDFDPAQLKSNEFMLEWPPRSGERKSFPEVDRAAWFSLDESKRKILKGQLPLLEELGRLLGEFAIS